MKEQKLTKALSKHARILMLFKEKRRVTQRELNRISYRYGSVIHDLRKEGHEIVTVPIDYTTGHFEYQYKRGISRKNKRDGMVYEELKDTPKSNFFTSRFKKVK